MPDTNKMMEDKIIILKRPSDGLYDPEHFVLGDPDLAEAIGRERDKMKGYGIDVFYEKGNLIMTDVGCFIAFLESYARRLYD